MRMQQQPASFWWAGAAAVEPAVEPEAVLEDSAAAVASIEQASLSSQTFTNAAKARFRGRTSCNLAAHAEFEAAQRSKLATYHSTVLHLQEIQSQDGLPIAREATAERDILSGL